MARHSCLEDCCILSGSQIHSHTCTRYIASVGTRHIGYGPWLILVETLAATNLTPTVENASTESWCNTAVERNTSSLGSVHTRLYGGRHTYTHTRIPLRHQSVGVSA